MRPFASASRHDVVFRRGAVVAALSLGSHEALPKLRLRINPLCHQACGGKGHISATTPTSHMTISAHGHPPSTHAAADGTIIVLPAASGEPHGPGRMPTEKLLKELRPLLLARKHAV